MRIGALEAGGTKMVLAVGDENGNIFERMVIPTGTPEETVPDMINFFREQEVEALGIATFGPVDVNPGSKTYGNILATPKLSWVDYPLLKTFKEALDIPVLIDTDVNGACLGEITFGDSKGLTDVIYITVGTGIGVGIVSGGNMVHGMLHPEAGHIPMRDKPSDPGACICPYHRNCLEGLASGPSIENRWSMKPENLLDRDEVWEIEAAYLSDALVTFIMTLSPQRIIMGGGVMHVEKLFPILRSKVTHKLGGYLRTRELMDIESYIVPPSLNDNQGILGALVLGRRAAEAITD